MMTLEQLKGYMGIALSDTSQDVILSLYLETALEVAKEYTNKFDWDSGKPLPAGIKLGIIRWVELSQLKKDNAGVQSESIGGMSQTFTSAGDDSYFSEVFDMWGIYHHEDRGLVFRAVKRSKPVCDPRLNTLIRRL